MRYVFVAAGVAFILLWDALYNEGRYFNVGLDWLVSLYRAMGGA